MENEELLLCSKCKKIPRLYCLSGLWYVQCSGKCDRLEMARTRKVVIENWNALNHKGANYSRAAIEAHAARKERVFQLDSNGKQIYEFDSVEQLARVLKRNKHEIISRFNRAKTGKIKVKGVTFYKEGAGC